MKYFNAEMIEKAKTVKSAEELLELVKANGVEMTADEAATYFAQLNPKSGELSDDELDNVAGGACASDSTGRAVVTSGCQCFTGQFQPNSVLSPEEFAIKRPVYRKDFLARTDNLEIRALWCQFAAKDTCGSCIHLEFEGGIGVCGKS